MDGIIMNRQLTIINQSGKEVDTIGLAEIAETIISLEREQIEYEISLVLVTSTEMRALNKRYRGQDAATDVLTFEVEGDDLPDQMRDRAMIGDIIIDINQIEKQRGLNSIKDELVRVYVHGLLHLLGYDHIQSQDIEVMEQTEHKYLKIIRG